MTTTNEVKLIRIPCTATIPRQIHLTNIPLIEFGPGDLKNNDDNKDEHLDGEKHLTLFPNLKSRDDPHKLSWAHRHLIGLSNRKRLEESDNADFWMYICVDPNSKLHHNYFLERIANDYGRLPYPYVAPKFGIYGDALVFKTKPKLNENDTSERVEFMHMDEGSLPYDSSWASDLLKMLSMNPHKGEWKV